MKADLKDLAFFVVFMIVASVIVHFNRIPAVQAAQAQRLADERAFCQQLAERTITIVWDDEEDKCIIPEPKELLEAKKDE